MTGAFGESEAGGYWGPELKAAGYDGIIVKGQADAPVYLQVSNQTVELRDAAPYWGKLAHEVEDGIRAELGDKLYRIIQTGIAGENKVRYASIVNELKHFNGRCGLGAVMGAKNLKAIACRGKLRMQPADPALSKQVLDWFRSSYDRNNDPMHKFGTTRGIPSLNAEGILPTRNFQQGHMATAGNLSGQTMAKEILKKPGTCFACAIACKREVEVEELGVDPRYGGPEYENMAAHGSLLGVDNLKQVAKSNQILGQYVLDSISAGMAIAFAMECYQHGLITKEDTGGLELTWGNFEAAQQLIVMISRRQGIGDLLAEGVARAAEKIGNGAERFALHVKRQELPMHEPRGKKSLALAYAISPTGADHVEAPHDPFFTAFHAETIMVPELGILESSQPKDLDRRKTKIFYKMQRVWSMYNTIGMCNFAAAPINAISLTKIVEFLRAMTGWDVSLHELLQTGERADTMSRIFNVREGFTPEDDTLPGRLFEPLEGPLDGERVDPREFEQALADYYLLAGWDAKTGMPTKAKLMELDLEWAAPEAMNLGVG